MNTIGSEAPKSTISRWLFFLGTAIFSYTLIKALSLSVTYDEAYCYQKFARNGMFYGESTSAVNIQLLNNFLTILTSKIFGPEEFFLRIPNLIAHIFFLVYSAKLLKSSLDIRLVIPCFLLLNLNPYMLDFFSLARQYGLSFGMMITSIYYLHRYNLNRDRIKYASLSMLFGALAVFASIVQLNFFMTLIAAIVFLNIVEARKQNAGKKNGFLLFLKRSIFPGIIFVLVLLVIIPSAIGMKESKQLFFGTNNGFLEDTLGSVIGGTLYGQYNGIPLLQTLAFGFIFCLLTGTTLFLVYRFYKRELNKETFFIGALLWFLCGSALSTILQFHLLGTLLLLNRTAIFFIILFNLILIFSANEWIKKWRTSVFVFILTLSGLFTLHFFNSIDRKKVFEWEGDADTKMMLADLEKIRNETGKSELIRLGISNYFQPTIDFYRETKELLWLNPALDLPNPIGIDAHYFYFLKNDLENIRPDTMTILKTYPLSGNVLAKRKVEPLRIIDVHKRTQDFENIEEEDKSINTDEHLSGSKSFYYDSEREYGRKLEIELDSGMISKNLVLKYTYAVLAKDNDKTDLDAVISVFRGDQELKHVSTSIRDVITVNDKWIKGQVAIVLPPDLLPGDLLRAYIWNPRKGEMYVDDMELELTAEIFNN